MTTTSINQTEIIISDETTLDGQVDGQANGNSIQAQAVQAGAEGHQPSKGKPESALRAAARRHGLTLKELASLMGVNYGHLCSVANGRRPWTPMMTERVTAVLGEVPGQGIVYRQGGVITAESSYIRERARELGMSLKALAVVVGVSYRYMTQAARGHRNMSPSVQARVESALGAPAKVEPALLANRLGSVANGGSTFIRERARELGLSMGELEDLVGVSRGYMSDVARGRRCMSPQVQARVEAVLDAPIRVEAAQLPTVDPRALWDRMEAHGWSQNETARRAGISSALLSQIMNGKRTPSGRVLEKLHGVLFQPTAAELVVPARSRCWPGRRAGATAWWCAARAARGWWPEPRRRHHPHRRPRALGRRGGVRLPRRLRQPGPGVGDPPGGREGLRLDAEPDRAGRCLVQCYKNTANPGGFRGMMMFRDLKSGPGTYTKR